jgi:hypothetical protein
MFYPVDQPLERGWVGRIDGGRVVQLAAQTLQAFFLGGGAAREHADYALENVRLLAPVQFPPTVRIFRRADDFQFANATAVVGTEVVVPRPAPQLGVSARLAAVVGADEAVGGYTGFLEWNGNVHGSAKWNDYGLALGPIVVTPDELDPGARSYTLLWRDSTGAEAAATSGLVGSFDWDAATRLAAFGTTLRPGDVLAGPSIGVIDGITDGAVELEVEGIGPLTSVLGDPI